MAAWQGTRPPGGLRSPKRLRRAALVLGLLLGAGGLVLIGRPLLCGGPPRPAVEAPPPPEISHPSTIRTPTVSATIRGLPAFAYVGEKLNFSVRLVNQANEALRCRVSYSPPEGAAEEREVELAPGAEELAVFGLAARDSRSVGRAWVRCRQGDEVLWAESFLFWGGRGSLDGLTAKGREIRTADGERVILTNEYEQEESYQRWPIVRWARNARLWRRAAVLCSLADGCFGSTAEEARERLSASLPGRAIQMAPCAGGPIETLLAFESKPLPAGPLIVCLGWGFEEARTRFPPRDLARAIDLLIDRVRERNPEAQFLLASPPPIVGEEEATRAVADAIEAVAREHHARFLDLCGELLRQTAWRELYQLDGDPSVFQLHTNEKGREVLLRKLAEALR